MLIKEYETNARLVYAINPLDVTVVKYLKWKRVDDGQKMRYKEVEEHLSKAEIVKHIDSEVEEFREHVNRIHVQYQDIRKLHETLFGEEIVIWMDLAENYGCTSVEEVQYNQSTGTQQLSHCIQWLYTLKVANEQRHRAMLPSPML